MPDEVLTIKEVAALLKLAEKDRLHHGERWRDTGLQDPGQWHIKRADLDKWLDAQPRGGEGGCHGYAMSRFEWPVHFGLINNDCRWIMFRPSPCTGMRPNPIQGVEG